MPPVKEGLRVDPVGTTDRRNVYLGGNGIGFITTDALNLYVAMEKPSIKVPVSLLEAINQTRANPSRRGPRDAFPSATFEPTMDPRSRTILVDGQAIGNFHFEGGEYVAEFAINKKPSVKLPFEVIIDIISAKNEIVANSQKSKK